MNNTDNQIEVAKPHRVYSVFRNIGWAAIVAIGCMVTALSLNFAGQLNGLAPLKWLAPLPFFCFLVLAVFGLPGAIIQGLLRPYRSDEKIPRKKVVSAWVLGVVGTLWVSAQILLVVMITRSFSAAGRQIDGNYATLEELRKERIANVVLVDDMIPPMATDIHFKGRGGAGLLAFARGCQFCCKVSEADFRAFAAEKGYELSKNVLRNANTEIVDGDRYPAETDLASVALILFDSDSLRPQIGNYLGYWYGYRNYGGTILVYDLDNGILYGSYSSN